MPIEGVIAQAIEWIRQYLQPGLLGYSSLFLAMIVQVIVPPIPAEFVVIAAAKSFGPWITGFVAGAGLWVGSMAVYCIGRFFRNRFDRFFGKRQLKRAIEKLHEHETPILWLRILPYNPSDVISYAAGIIGTDVRKFARISAVTSIVRCYALAFIGETIKDASTLLAAFGILAISAIVAYAFFWRK